jgi:heavy metal sensor kinase
VIRSLRAQLALWHGGLLALTLVLLASLIYVMLRQVLSSLADAALQDYADKTARNIAAGVYQAETLSPKRTLVPDERRALDDEVVKTYLNTSTSWGRFVQIDDVRGFYTAVSDALRTVRFPDNPDTRTLILSHRERVAFETVTDPFPYPVRIVTVPVEMGERIPYLVRVGAPVEGVEEAIYRVQTLLLVLTPSIFIIALAGGWVLVGRALKPVDEMTRAALSIESRRLDVRLVPPRTDNEIGRLASALNEMIARLDRSFRQTERFTADASHELKTPLTTIRGEAEVALMGNLAPEQIKATLHSIVEETERLSEIVNNLLLLSRADAEQIRLKHEPVALDQVAMQAYEPMERLAHRKSITLDIAAMEEITLSGDSLWLHQLITNLLHNAINYTPEGGKVTLSVAREGDSAVLKVWDTGPGIPPEHLPHIFDRFYRVDSGRSRDQGGSGLGLNIARWIVESHGGSLTAESTPGSGATFTARLPLHSAPPERERQAA